MMKNITDEYIIDNIEIALKLLKEKKILYFKTLTTGNTFFVLRQNKIYVNGTNSSYILKIEEFIDLYQNQHFLIYEGEEEHIDPLRDEEYYRWKHK